MKFERLRTLPCLQDVSDYNIELMARVINKYQKDGTFVLNPEAMPRTAKWIDRCYSEPDTIEKVFSALGELSGLEHDYIEEIDCEFLNAGDPYETTVLYVNDKFRIDCWGDIMERADYD